MKEQWLVKCLDCGSQHTEIYPDGQSGSESFSNPADPKRCDCIGPQYELLVQLA